MEVAGTRRESLRTRTSSQIAFSHDFGQTGRRVLRIISSYVDKNQKST